MAAPLAHDEPLVSVVVPTCGRVALLSRCLKALLGQQLPAGRVEILVVDDGPHAATRPLGGMWTIEDAGVHVPARFLVRYLANTGRHGPAAARNVGWRHARSSIIAFTDDDTIPDPHWLARGLAAFERGVDAVTGRVRMPLPPQATDYERDARQLESAEFVTANCFCRKQILQNIGGFDERFRLAWREDSDLHFRLLEAGAIIRHAPDALVEHPVRPAPWGVSLLQVRKIAFDALLYKKHPQLYREKIRATPRWDYYAIVAALAGAGLFLALGEALPALFCALLWFGMTARFCLRRLQGTVRTPSHIAEMLVTSALIPPLAVFWRAVGALRFRVRFA